MRAVEAAVLVAMVLFSAYLMVHKEDKPLTVVIGFREYGFSHSAGDLSRVDIYGNGSVAGFFLSHDNFTVTFDPSSEKDNGYFSKIGFNMVSKLNYFFIDMNMQKRFSAKTYDELNESDAAIILLRGPNSGAIRNGITVEGNTLIIEGLSYDELEKASERVVVEVFENVTGKAILPVG